MLLVVLEGQECGQLLFFQRTHFVERKAEVENSNMSVDAPYIPAFANWVSLPRTPPKYIVPAHTCRSLVLTAATRSIELLFKINLFRPNTPCNDRPGPSSLPQIRFSFKCF